MSGKRSAVPSAEDVLDRLETNDADRAIEDRLAEGARDGSFALVGGGLMLVGAIRSLLRGKLRGLLQGVLALAVLRYGLRQRESASDARSETDFGGGSTGKDVSDDAHGALERNEVDGQPRTDPVGEAESGVESGSDVSFTGDRDEPRAKPGLDADVEDPRRDDEGDVEIDVSEAALADEASEATGPDPEQAQPTRTEETEPESGAEEDASHVEHDVPGGDESERDEEEESGRPGFESDDEDDSPESATFGADDEDEDEDEERGVF